MGGSMTGGKGAPAPPDFSAAAEAQARSGHVNQSGPFGSTNWTQGPNGQWSQTTSLGGDFGTGVQNAGRQVATQGAVGTGDQAREQATQAYMARALSRLDPQWNQREDRMQTSLVNQGLDPGSEAATNAMGDFSRARNDAYAGAEADAQMEGAKQQALTFGQNVQAHRMPFEDAGALQGLLAGLSGRGPETQYMNAAGAQYGGALNQYGANQAGKNSLMGGAASLAPLAFL
jgi:hypothetical protein